MSLVERHKVAAATLMNRLHEVRWDRYAGSDIQLVVYGWLDREDDYKDFVMLEFMESEDGAPVHWITTSSAKYSREFDRRLRGTDEGHVDCERVDEFFGDLVVNKVILS